MKQHVTALERAFELASSGRFSTPEQIRRTLMAEGYSDRDFIGPAFVNSFV